MKSFIPKFMKIRYYLGNFQFLEAIGILTNYEAKVIFGPFLKFG
jgi:hypothetical protein